MDTSFHQKTLEHHLLPMSLVCHSWQRLFIKFVVLYLIFYLNPKNFWPCRKRTHQYQTQSYTIHMCMVHVNPGPWLSFLWPQMCLLSEIFYLHTFGTFIHVCLHITSVARALVFQFYTFLCSSYSAMHIMHTFDYLSSTIFWWYHQISIANYTIFYCQFMSDLFLWSFHFRTITPFVVPYSLYDPI